MLVAGRRALDREHFEENLAIKEEHSHSRYPLIGEDLQDFQGLVYLPAITTQFNDLMSGDLAIEEIAVTPMTLPADEAISDVVDRFQSERQEPALVEDDSEIVGLLTVTDVFEEVMGELENPIDVENARAAGSD